MPVRRQHGSRARLLRLGVLTISLIALAAIALTAWFRSGGAPPVSDDRVSSIGSEQAEAGRELFVRILDKDDTSRIAAELLAEAMEPLEPGRYKVLRPRAWYFLDSGETIHVRADSGDVVRPADAQAPERGVLIGDVEVRLFAPTGDGRRIDLDIDEPVASLRTDRLEFDAMLGELATDERVSITSDRVDFIGRGLRAYFNEPEQRINSLTVLSGRRMVLRPRTSPPSSNPPSPAVTPPTGERPPAGVVTNGPPPAIAQPRPVESPTRPRETLYLTTFEGDVVLSRDAGRLRADRLQIWSRLLDNRLPDDAIAPVFGTPFDSLGVTSADPMPIPAFLAAAAIARQPERPATTAPAETILEWSGSMTIRPLAETTPELASDHLFVRATSPGSGIVTLMDQESGATIECGIVSYAATSRLARFEADLSDPASAVTIGVPDSGSVRVPHLTAAIGDDGAELNLAGPGLAKGVEEDRTIRWTDHAAMQLVHANGRTELRSASFSGDAAVSDSRASIRGDSISADFVRSASCDTTPITLDAAGNVLVSDDQSGRLASDALHVRFDPAQADHSELTPTHVIATGNVRASQQSSTVTGDSLEADLVRRPKPGAATTEVAVTTAVIRGRATYASDDGRGEPISASADEIHADIDARIARLFAPEDAPASVSSGPSSIFGRQIQLDGLNRTALVWGPGTFTRTDPDTGRTIIDARWTSETTFDDIEGRLDARGDVHAVATSPDGTQRDALDAERVLLRFTPYARQAAAQPDSDHASVAFLPDQLGGDDRRLVRAEIFGQSYYDDAGAPASIESRRYDRSASTLIQLAYVEGAHLIADAQADAYEVPGPGRLVLTDRSPSDEESPEASAARGATLFDWDDSMTMVRATGDVEMLGRVRLTHIALGKLDESRLEADRVKARIRTDDAPDGEGQLLSAHAEGAVYFGAGPRGSRPVREFVTDTLTYDAQAGTALALAAPGRLMTVFDATRAAAVRATRAFWNLTDDTIELEGVRPITAPR